MNNVENHRSRSPWALVAGAFFAWLLPFLPH